MNLLNGNFCKQTSMSVMEIIYVTMTALMRMGLIYVHVILAMSYSLITGLVKVTLSS